MLLEVNNLSVRYQPAAKLVLNDVSLAVGEAEIVAIIGPSGSGKSTLIRCINRLVEPVSGSIKLAGQELTGLRGTALRQARQRIGMVFQEFNLIDRMSVMDNVLVGRCGRVGNLRSILRWYPRPDVEEALRLLDRVGMSEHVNKRADQLSGGQRQRVGVARALFQEPRILLCDEPTSALDPKISRAVMRLIIEMARDQQIPVLCNIHDVELARETCTRIIGLQDGQKVFAGAPAELDPKAMQAIYAMEVL